MNARFIGGFDGFQDRPEMRSAAEFIVEGFIRRFEVDIHGVDQGGQFGKGFRVDIAVGHQNVEQASFPEFGAAVEQKFIPHEGFGVGISYADGIAVLGKFSQIMGIYFFGGNSKLRNFTVLTEFTAEIAGIGADGEDLTAGMEMVKGFLFDRIDSGRGGAAVIRGIQPSSDIFPSPAISPLSGFQFAFTGADFADNALSFSAEIRHLDKRFRFHSIHQKEIMIGLRDYFRFLGGMAIYSISVGSGS